MLFTKQGGLTVRGKWRLALSESSVEENSSSLDCGTCEVLNDG